MVIALGVLFIMVNYLSSRHYARLDCTRQKITALSDQTRRTLTALPEPVTVIVFYQPSHRLYDLVRDLLAEYLRVTPKLSVNYVDPEQDVARARQLVQEAGLDVNDPSALNVVIVKSGMRQKRLSDADLAEYDYSSMESGGEPRVKAFKGEDALTSAIISVTRKEALRVWFTTGHGEKSVDSSDILGLAAVKKTLEQQNMQIEAVTLLERAAIPPDVKMVVVPGPTRRFTENEVLLLETYLEQGGKLLALIDPLNDTGLDGLLEKWGLALGLDIVVDPALRLPTVSPANLLVTTYTEHPIVRKMKTLVTLFPLARSVQPASPAPQGLAVTPLALTSDAGWGETQPSEDPFKFEKDADTPGPVPIAAAVERVPAPPVVGAQAGPGGRPTRLVVIGDSDFIVNAQLANVGNKDLLLGAAYWLIEQEQLIGIGPKPLESIKLRLTRDQMGQIFWFSFLAMPLTFGLLWAGVWFLRRT